MGNVFLVDQNDARTTISLRTFKGSDAAILQAEIAAFIATLIAGGTHGIKDINLAGSGDGEEFVVTMLTSTGTAAPSAGTTVLLFQASSFSELNVKMNAAYAALVAASATIRGCAVDGTCLGNHYIGLFLYTAGVQ